MKLPRLPGTKEARYAHRLSGAPQAESPRASGTPDSTFPDVSFAPVEPQAGAAPGESESIARLEREIEGLRQELHELRREIAGMRPRPE